MWHYLIFSFILNIVIYYRNLYVNKQFAEYISSLIVTNGPKEQLGAGEGANSSEEFEPWRTQQQNSAAHTAYGGSVPISSATDLYSMNTAGNVHSSQLWPSYLSDLQCVSREFYGLCNVKRWLILFVS